MQLYSRNAQIQNLLQKQNKQTKQKLESSKPKEIICCWLPNFVETADKNAKELKLYDRHQDCASLFERFYWSYSPLPKTFVRTSPKPVV